MYTLDIYAFIYAALYWLFIVHLFCSLCSRRRSRELTPPNLFAQLFLDSRAER